MMQWNLFIAEAEDHEFLYTLPITMQDKTGYPAINLSLQGCYVPHFLLADQVNPNSNIELRPTSIGR